jgi:hypothetical protein
MDLTLLLNKAVQNNVPVANNTLGSTKMKSGCKKQEIFEGPKRSASIKKEPVKIPIATRIYKLKTARNKPRNLTPKYVSLLIDVVKITASIRYIASLNTTFALNMVPENMENSESKAVILVIT